MATKTVRQNRRSATQSRPNAKNRPRLAPAIDTYESPFSSGPIGSGSMMDLCHPVGSGSGFGMPNSGSTYNASDLKSRVINLFPKNYLIPVHLICFADQPTSGGRAAKRREFEQPISLIHSQDLAAPGRWYSGAIDLGDASGDPAFWMLERTSKDSWQFCLRRITGEIASFKAKSKSAKFPLVLSRQNATGRFRWPKSVTIRQPD
jgi:hypothetical protein